MKITAKIEKIVDCKNGQNATSGKKWCKTTLLISWYEEVQNGSSYAHSMVADTWGELKEDQLNFAITTKVEMPMSLKFATREYNEKLYNDVNVLLPTDYYTRNS